MAVSEGIQPGLTMLQEPEPLASSDRPRPAISVLIPLGLAVSVWLIGFLSLTTKVPVPKGAPLIYSGSISELGPAIRHAPRAMVYVGSPATTYGVHGRRLFLSSSERISREHSDLGIKLFVIENESAEDARQWAQSLEDERVETFGYLGYGWLLWLESGKLREVDPYFGDFRLKSQSVEQTLSLWQKER